MRVPIRLAIAAACTLAAGCGGEREPVATPPAPATTAQEAPARTTATRERKPRRERKRPRRSRTTATTAPAVPVLPAPKAPPLLRGEGVAAIAALCRRELGPVPARPSDAGVAAYAAERAVRAQTLVDALAAARGSGAAADARAEVLDAYSRLLPGYQQLEGAAAGGNAAAIARLAPAIFAGEDASAKQLRARGLAACAPTR